MPDNRNNVEIEPIADAPLLPRNSYTQSNNYESPNYGEKAIGNQARLALLRDWLRIIYRHRWMILSIVLVALSFAAIQAYHVKPVYQATTTIDISPETSSLSKAGGVLLFGSSDNTKAEAIIIKSQPVLKKTILSLNLDKNPGFFDPGALKPNTEEIASLKGGRPEREKELAREDVNDKSLAGPAEILTTTRAERVKLAPYIQALLNNLKVEGVRETRLIKVSFTHTNPEIAATVANGVANSFISHNFQMKTERFTNTSKWLEESTRTLKEQVEQAEQKLANYSRQNNIFSLEGKENLTADKMVRLHDQAMRAETARLLKQTLFDEVKKGRGAQLPEAFADPKTAELRKTFNDLAVTASQLSVKFGPKHPKLLEIRQQMATLQEQIKDNQSMLEERLKADYGRAVGEEKSLKAALMISKSEAVRQNQAAIQYSILQQDLATAKSLYMDFLNKTSQANIQRAEQFNNVRLIEGAEPPDSPIGPNRYLPIMFSLILSLTLGIGLAYLLENLNTTLRTVDDVARVTQLPMLAVIPTLKAAIPQVMLQSITAPALTGRQKKNGNLQAADPVEIPDSSEQLDDLSDEPVVAKSERMVWAAGEAYRMLRTSILLSTAERPPKTVLVTSGQPGDGKTATVFNIAYALAQLNAEVVIVDCDMRKPRTRKLHQLANDEGLSTLLTGGGALDEFIKTTSVPHLSILPCGASPPNPSELISSDKMKGILRSLAESFEYVIIDSPPLATFTDPMILSTLVDGVILVVKSGRSKSELVRRVCQDLSGVGAKVLGVTLNSFNMRKEGYGYYQYYRYYSDYNHSDYTGQYSRNHADE
jgi:polysaccharide biosynthesis transport protein